MPLKKIQFIADEMAEKQLEKLLMTPIIVRILLFSSWKA